MKNIFLVFIQDLKRISLDGQYDRLTKLVHTGLEAIGEWEHHRMEKK